MLWCTLLQNWKGHRKRCSAQHSGSGVPHSKHKGLQKIKRMSSLRDYLPCPWCGGLIEVVAINCAIFRHGTFKHNGLQIPPHSKETEVAAWLQTPGLQGCGQPFRYVSVKATPGSALLEPCGWDT